MRVTKAVKAEQLRILRSLYPNAKPALTFQTPFELLIAVILSAQCTDARVNVVTGRLFPKANTPAAIAALGQTALEAEIHDCGFFRMKAKHIIETCHILLDDYGGAVPADFEALQKLPGVGRKTANVVMSVAFHTPAIDSARGLERRTSLADPARKAGLQGAQAALRYVCSCSGLPEQHGVRCGGERRYMRDLSQGKI